LHSGDVLDGPRDPDGDVEGGGNDLASLTDLIVAGGIPGVHRGTARADGGAQSVREGFDDLEEFLLEGTAARHDDVGLRELGPLGGDRVEGDVLDARGGAARGRLGDLLDG